MDQNTNPTTPETPTFTPEQQALIERQATERAEAISNQKVEAMKEELARTLSGKQDSPAPKSWSELEERIGSSATERAIKAAEERITKKFEDQQKAAEDKQKQTLAQQEEQNKAEWARMSAEWKEAVDDGVIPDIDKEIKKKLTSGVNYSDLTAEEQNDPGLKAYNEGRLLHIKLRSEGKSNTFYRTLQKFWNKQPAGAGAPVLGGSTPTTPQSDAFSYDDVQANRKKRFGY